MCKRVCVLLLLLMLFCPVNAFAADLKINVSIVRQEDGITLGELWYNNQMVWRLALLSDGAQPVSTGNTAVTTFITPDILNGLFIVKVQ